MPLKPLFYSGYILTKNLFFSTADLCYAGRKLSELDIFQDGKMTTSFLQFLKKEFKVPEMLTVYSSS